MLVFASGQIPKADQVKVPPDDEFSELDYRPPKINYIRPLIVVVVVLAMVVTGLVMLLGNGEDTIADSDSNDLETTVEEQPSGDTVDPEADQPETDFEPTDESEDEEADAEVELLPPNYDLIEEALHEWLKIRVDDPNVILLPAEALDDFDRFFELYDLEEDNVIVYQVETADTEFVTAVLGVPFSEWSLKAVFIWRENSWAFLREETIR